VGQDSPNRLAPHTAAKLLHKHLRVVLISRQRFGDRGRQSFRAHPFSGLHRTLTSTEQTVHRRA